MIHRENRDSARIGKAYGFAPIAAPDARVVILGTLPGTVSLARGEYYAQPRNSFWRIMSELGGASLDAAYPDRTNRLIELGLAVWDVCAEAKRLGALDAMIDQSTVVVNDFTSFLTRHPAVGLICFNGAMAAKLYNRKVLPDLPKVYQSLPHETLPSTSPAHAALPFAQKLARWHTVLRAQLGM